MKFGSWTYNGFKVFFSFQSFLKNRQCSTITHLQLAIQEREGCFHFFIMFNVSLSKTEAVFKKTFFFVTYEWAKLVRVFAPGRPLQPVSILA
jgi:hypothetical protein